MKVNKFFAANASPSRVSQRRPQLIWGKEQKSETLKGNLQVHVGKVKCAEGRFLSARTKKLKKCDDP